MIMKISVVMTVYNGAKYLQKQMLSILQQTRLPDQIVIANDCSVDRSMELIERLREQWPQISWCVYTNPENLGWQKNFMKAFEHAEGELIFCSDQDDVWTAEKIERMERAFSDYPEAELIGCDYTLIGKNGESQGDRRLLYSPKRTCETMEKIPLAPTYYEAVRPGCAIAFRKSFLQNVRSYWVQGYPHDELLWNMAVVRGTAFVLHEVLLNYRIHGENTTSAKNTLDERIQMLEYQKNACIQCVKYARENGMDKKTCDMLQAGVQFFEIRSKALTEKNTISLLMVLKYFRYYTYKPAYLKDWQYLLKKYEGREMH